MASTNKTTNYNLSQFIGADKPAWLQDYNGDMLKIDNGIAAAASTATGADGKADANTTKIGDLSTLTTTAKTSAVAAINEVDSNADSAYNLASGAAQTANTADGKVDTLAAKFNFVSFNDYTPTFNGNGTLHTSRKTLTVAKNSDGSICKIYGDVQINNPSNLNTIKISGTGLAPSSDITIKCCGVVRNLTQGVGATSSSEDYIHGADLIIKTNGDVLLLPDANSTYYNNGMIEWIFHPVVIFVKDFGDTPTPPEQ